MDSTEALDIIASTTHAFLRAEIYHDPDREQPELLTAITYNSRSRYTLGTETADEDRDSEIARKVRDGEYVGIPVWAYVHGGATVRAEFSNPFGCPWDSGRSGWAYIPRDVVLRELAPTPGRKRVSRKLLEQVYGFIRAEVGEFSAWLDGDCYGVIIRDTRTDEELDSCWGFVGHDYAMTSAREMLKSVEDTTPLQLELNLNPVGSGESHA